MGLFGLGRSLKAQELDQIQKSLLLAFENNYKDNATANLKKLEAVFEEAKEKKQLKDREIREYETLLADLKERLKNFDHKQPVQR